MALYMMVTKDKYELPLAVAGSATELSRMTGVPEMQIYSQASKYRHGLLKRSKFVRVEDYEEE